MTSDQNRATRSDLSGYRADTDDWLSEIEHDEQRIDPNREVSARQGRGASGPMMPPMAMGGGQGAVATGAPAGASLARVAPGGSQGAGGATGLWTGSSAASGAGPIGIDTDGDGIADTFSGGGIDTDGDGIPDLFPGDPGYPSSGNHFSVNARDSLTSAGSATATGTPTAAEVDSGQGVDVGDGVEVIPEEISQAAAQWSRVAAQMSQLLWTAGQADPNTTDFGFITPPTEQYSTLHTNITRWSLAAEKEFGVMADKLLSGASSYRQLEEEHISTSATIHQETP